MLGLLPLLTTDFRLQLQPGLRVFLGVMPFCAVIGFVTPMLVDRWALGDPARAGKAYAWNVLGCILGPIISGFLTLPRLGERVPLLLFYSALFRNRRVCYLGAPAPSRWTVPAVRRRCHNHGDFFQHGCLRKTLSGLRGFKGQHCYSNRRH